MSSGGSRSEHEGTNDRLSEDAIFQLLSNRRRRNALRYLSGRDEPVTVGELADQVAAWENGVSVSDVTRKQRKSVYASLQQNHLQRLRDAGVIRADRRWRNIELTDRASEFEGYFPGDSRTASFGGVRFFALSLIELALIANLWLDPLPGSPTPNPGTTVLFASVLFLMITVATVLPRSTPGGKRGIVPRSLRN